MNMGDKSVAILGGTFNPPHNGHMELARAAIEMVSPDVLLFMPAANTYYKASADLISVECRTEMLKRAVSDRFDININAEADGGVVESPTGNKTRIEISMLDAKRDKTTYTCDTIADVKRLYGGEVFFIAGTDSLLYMDKWKDAEYIFKNAVILTGKRDVNTYDDIYKKADFLKKNFNARIIFLDVTEYPISSSSIREIFKEKEYKDRSVAEFLEKMVPPSVIEYIIKNKVYDKCKGEA